VLGGLVLLVGDRRRLRAAAAPLSVALSHAHSSTATNQTKPNKKQNPHGLAKLLRDNYYIVNRSGSGTVTHLAPELFQVGSKVTTAVDTFSFGIMMWELYTGRRAYAGLGRDSIIDRVYKQHSRAFLLFVFTVGVVARGFCWGGEGAGRV
jgi:hypothetical protein